MSSLISDQIKNAASQAIDSLADTFSRPIIIIQEIANATVLDAENYNPLSDARDINDVIYTANSVTINARVKFLDRADSETELIFNGRGGSKAVSTALRQDYGIVRIKYQSQYTQLVKSSTKIIVDGFDCQLLFNYTPQSLFGLNYTIAYLSRQM